MENKDEAKRIKLLICQGGGCRGIISIRFLLEVQDLLYNNPITHYSGTSIGGINILYLARGKSIEKLLSVSDVHIFADLIDAIIVACAVIKLLHIKWHKHRK